MYKVKLVIMCFLISGKLFAADLSKEIVGAWKVKQAIVDGKVIQKGNSAECSFCDLLNGGIPLVFDASGKVQYGGGARSALMFYTVSGKKLILSHNALQANELKHIKANKEKGIEVMVIEGSKTGITLAFTFNGHKEIYQLEK
jgi:hypothetical protein